MIKLDQFDAQLGIRTLIHETENKFVIEKRFDAEPLIETAAEMRSTRQMERWDERGTHVGFIPMAELGTMMRQDGGFDKARVLAYLRKNPALVTFDKFLKV